MAYVWILLAFMLFIIGSFLTYSKDIHGRWWFPYSLAFLSLITGYLWAVICKITPEKNQIVVYSIYWDILIAFAYYGIPAVSGMIQLTNTSYCGMMLVVVGIILIHF